MGEAHFGFGPLKPLVVGVANSQVSPLALTTPKYGYFISVAHMCLLFRGYCRVCLPKHGLDSINLFVV